MRDTAAQKRRYRIGSRNKVSAVELASPPMTTIASGRWISEPGPVANSTGSKPNAAIVAVIALLISWVPFLGALTALIALGLGIGAWVSTKKGGRPAGLAIAATVISILAFLIGVVVSIGFLILIDQAQEADRYCNSVSTTQAEYDACIEDRVTSWFGVDTTP